MGYIIAIDGPAGSGKGTIAKKIAELCNCLYIDTGAMYRCLALAILENNIDLEDKENIMKLLEKIKINFDEQGKVYLNEKNVTEEIRSKEVTKIVSPISSIIEVRDVMVNLQRKMAKDKNVVMEGRDITTYVFPQAEFKFYIDADVLVRAKRRFKQYQEKGIDMNLEEIIDNIEKRDYNDMNKSVGALKRTDDQIYIDTSNLTIEETINKMIKIIRSDK